MDLVLFPAHPGKQILHQPRHGSSRRGHEDTGIAVKDPFFTPPKDTRLFYGISGHDPMEFFQVRQSIRIDRREFFVSGIGVFDFLDLLLFPQDRAAIYDVSDLAKA